MTRRGRPSLRLLGGAALLLVAACGSESPTQSGTIEVNDMVTEIVDDLNAYWQEADAELGFDYSRIPHDQVGSAEDGLTCNLQLLDPVEIEESDAFVDGGCSEGIIVAYHAAEIGRSLAVAEATLAHEWGHVLQLQAPHINLAQKSGLPIDRELQADCLAGAWAGERAITGVEALRAEVAETGDEGDVALDDPDAHGYADERQLAFDIGFEGGPRACIDELIDALPG